MAIKNPNNDQYYKVMIDEPERAELSVVRFNVYLNEEARFNPPNDFIQPKTEMYFPANYSLLDFILQNQFPAGADGLLTAIYSYLKTTPEFENFIDC